ncbi:UNVERIFIED_CONTAM: hypothetical protein NY603_17165, partial [Bacteroidetes bacterium 56_B9]
MSTQIPPEMRLWRTDSSKGRHIYALLSSDPTRPSDDDPLVGVMESAVVAEDIVSTHNGALAKYGRRYAQVLATAEVGKSTSESEVYFKISPGEREQLLALTEWLNSGPFRALAIV